MSAFSDKIKQFFSAGKIDEDLLDNLCDLLVEGDFGAALAYKTTELLREKCKKEKAPTPEAVKHLLASILEKMLVQNTQETPWTAPITGEGDTAPVHQQTLVMLLGVNGVGKTTTAAKLGALFSQIPGQHPILAACDTFRAAAIDQLKIHGQRLGLRVVAHKHGADPAAVIYDALAAAVGAASYGGANCVIADTAGRMHTKTALVEELKKIDRVAEKFAESKAPGAGSFQSVKWLVLDAVTGTNALSQAEVFHDAVRLDGVILTKCDSSAKGGIVFPLAETLKIPVIYLCAGEQYDDIQRFDAKTYVQEFLGR